MGGLVAGAVGSLLGGGGVSSVVGGLLGGGGPLGGLVDSLAEQFGLDDVASGIQNTLGGLLGQGLSSLVGGLPIPPFMQDMALSVIDDVIGGDQQEVPCNCQDAVNAELGEELQSIVDRIMDMLQQMTEETANEMAEDAGAGDGGESGGGEGANWLVALAKVLGRASGNHLATMIEKGTELSNLEGNSDNVEEYSEVNAEFQAASQIYKMSSEGISTMLKSIGEALSAVSRKQ